MTAPELRQITAAIRGRLYQAQIRGEIPRQLSYVRRGIDYCVMTSRVIRTGQITVRIEISSFLWLVPEPQSDHDITAWMLGPGRELVAAVDRIAGRSTWEPPLAGRTELIAEFTLSEPPEDGQP